MGKLSRPGLPTGLTDPCKGPRKQLQGLLISFPKKHVELMQIISNPANTLKSVAIKRKAISDLGKLQKDIKDASSALLKCENSNRTAGPGV